MAADPIVEAALAVRDGARSAQRVDAADLAGGAWRARLGEAGVLEVVDGGEGAGWLLSDAAMSAVIGAAGLLHERAGVAAIVEARRGYDDWMCGEELERAALEVFDRRGEAIKAALGA